MEDIVTVLRGYVKTISTCIDTIEEEQNRNAEHNGTPVSIKAARALQASNMKVKVAKQNLIETSTMLQRSIMTPAEFQQQMSANTSHLSTLRWLTHFNIPKFVPLDSPIAYDELAREACVPEDQLRRIIRMGMTADLFRETEDGRVSHSKISAQLQPGTAFHSACAFLTQVTGPVGMKMVEMTEAWDSSTENNKLAFNIALETDLSMYEYLPQNPKVATLLAGAMAFRGADGSNDLMHLVHGFDWASLGRAKVVDIGGSLGMASILLGAHFAHLKFSVQDLPDVIGRAQAAWRNHELYPMLAEHINFRPHDFFKPQPVEECDAAVFLLRQILNNWSDAAAVNILENIVKWMRPGARLVIMNTVLPKPGSVGPLEESGGRAADLFMMQAMRGKERDMEEWTTLLASVDSRLKIIDVQKPKGSSYSVIEVRLIAR